MSHGGKRPGAGRKPGAANKKTRLVADRAAAEGITPLEVMLVAMREAYAAGHIAAAAAFAKDAAPYMHPKLAAIAPEPPIDTDLDLTRLSDAEISARLRQLRANRDSPVPRRAAKVTRAVH